MRWTARLIGAERAIVGVAGIAGLALACWQVGERYLFPQLGSSWAEEAVVYVVGFATFLGVSILIFDDKHIRADVVVRMLPAAARRSIELVNCSLGLLFCGVLCWYGFAVTLDAFVTDERSVTGSAFPIWLFYAALPLGMLLSIAWYLRRIYRIAFGLDAATFLARSGHDA